MDSGVVSSFGPRAFEFVSPRGRARDRAVAVADGRSMWDAGGGVVVLWRVELEVPVPVYRRKWLKCPVVASAYHHHDSAWVPPSNAGRRALRLG